MGHAEFFETLEREFHDGVTLRRRGTDEIELYRWRQERYKQWPEMGEKKVVRSMEGWFKAEIGLFLDTLLPQVIASWDIEEGVRGKADFLVRFADAETLQLECKCVYEGRQGKQVQGKRGPRKRQKTAYETRLNDVLKDLEKKIHIPEKTQRYSVLFCYPSFKIGELEHFRDTLIERNRNKSKLLFEEIAPYVPQESSALSIVKLKVLPKLLNSKGDTIVV